LVSDNLGLSQRCC